MNSADKTVTAKGQSAGFILKTGRFAKLYRGCIKTVKVRGRI